MSSLALSALLIHPSPTAPSPPPPPPAPVLLLLLLAAARLVLVLVLMAFPGLGSAPGDVGPWKAGLRPWGGVVQGVSWVVVGGATTFAGVSG